MSVQRRILIEGIPTVCFVEAKTDSNSHHLIQTEFFSADLESEFDFTDSCY
jgi:hypothetical protein